MGKDKNNYNLDTSTTNKSLTDDSNDNVRNNQNKNTLVSNNQNKDTLVAKTVENEDFATSTTNPAETENEINRELLQTIIQNDILDHVSHKNNGVNVSNN